MRTAALAAILLATTSMAATAQEARPVIASEADLPPVRFPTPVAPSRALNTSEFLAEALPPARAEAERLLATYDVRDPVIAQRLRVGLAAIAILQDRPEEALRLVGQQRAAETKPQLRQAGGVIREALAASAAAGGSCGAAADRITQTLAGADPLVVRDEVLMRYGVVQTVSPAFHAGSAAIIMDPEAEATGSLDVVSMMLMANMRLEGDRLPACRAEMAAAMKAWLDDPAHRPTDIWPARVVQPEDVRDAALVVAAVWEAGFDPVLFPGQIAFDPAEPLDGVDNDGNGVVDDSFGPTFDGFLRPTADRSSPASPELTARLGLQTALEKGLADLQYGDDTPEARFVAQRSRDAGLDEQLGDVRVSSEWHGWAHATAVASIIADTAPFVRLYAVAALPVGDFPDPVPHDEATVARWVEVMATLPARLNGAGVRVVNMSWKTDADELAEGLLRSGAETDPARAGERGAAMFRTLRAAIDGVLRDCPTILFVAGAGNDDTPDAVLGAAPQTLERSNLLVVGGAGTSGAPTAFTTYGAGVRLYALAEGNRVRIPGGQVMRGSGTSYASPNVVRIAATMLAVNPSLTPEQLIEGLLSTAHPAPTADLPLVDEGAAVRWARGRR